MTEVKPAGAAQRALICRTILDIMRRSCLAYRGHERFGEVTAEFVIGCALMIGQGEGKLMSASDVAAFVGMPRSTVARKLREGELSGRLKSSQKGSRRTYWVAAANDKDGIGNASYMTRRMQRACDQLAKLGNSTLD